MIKSFFFRKKESLLSPNYLKFLNNILGIYPKSEHLYLEAITHASYKKNKKEIKDNERLEFLGDAFISMAIGEYLFEQYPDEKEGFLSQLRAKVVSREQLNSLGKKIGLDEHILYQKSSNKYKSLIGNAFEALFGAILLDQGINKTQKVFREVIIVKFIDLNAIQIEQRDFKSELLVYCQKDQKKLSFKTKSKDLKNGEHLFKVGAYIEDVEKSNGIGYSKKEAEQNASKNIILTLNHF